MANLTQNAYLRISGLEYRHKYFIDTSVAQHFYRGQPVLIDQSADTINVTAYVDAVVVDPSDVFVGWAAEEKIVALGDPETTELEVIVAPTIVGFPSAVFDNSDLGKTVYFSDSATLSETAADNPQTGKLDSVEDGFAYIQSTSPQICGGA